MPLYANEMILNKEKILDIHKNLVNYFRLTQIYEKIAD